MQVDASLEQVGLGWSSMCLMEVKDHHSAIELRGYMANQDPEKTHEILGIRSVADLIAHPVRVFRLNGTKDGDGGCLITVEHLEHRIFLRLPDLDTVLPQMSRGLIDINHIGSFLKFLEELYREIVLGYSVLF